MKTIEKYLLLVFVLFCGMACNGKSGDDERIVPKPPVQFEDPFLIGIYVAPGINFTTDEQYGWIRAAHIDFIQDISVNYTTAQKLNMLTMAAKHDLKMYVADQRIEGTAQDIAALVADYKNHAATSGYYIIDEPKANKLDWAAETYKRVLALDPEKVPHVNLFPNYATGALANLDYEKDYVEKWIEKVGPQNLKYLAFDNYPFMADGSFRGVEYYSNLDIIRRIGLKYGIRTSSYLQSIGVKEIYRRPTENELRFSAYSNLAYGIKKPVWFTYWTPVGASESFTDAIVDTEGKKTDLYAPFQKLNAELKQLGSVLIKLDATKVYHSGTQLPEKTERVPTNFAFQPVDATIDLLITDFIDPSTKKKYVMVVNKSLTASKEIVFKLTATVGVVQEISKDNGKEVAVNQQNKIITQNFQAGEGKLFLVN